MALISTEQLIGLQERMTAVAYVFNRIAQDFDIYIPRSLLMSIDGGNVSTETGPHAVPCKTDTLWTTPTGGR